MAEGNKITALSPRQPLNGKRVLRIPGLTKNIATWNVTSMFEAGKLRNIIQEMRRLNVDILGISESRWPGSGRVIQDDSVVYYSGNDEPQHRNGVASIVKKNIAHSVKNVVALSDRAIMLQLAGSPMDITLIQVYAPTADKEEQLVEEFYEQIKQLLKCTKSRDVCVVMGDFNSKIGKGKQGNSVGNFGLGQRNIRGDRLIQFYEENKLIVANTFFQHPPRRLYTWSSPKDNESNLIRNQIDFILVNERFKNCIKNVKSYPGADVNSNHNPIIAKINIRLKRLQRTQKQKESDF